jgi:hypothetical protein
LLNTNLDPAQGFDNSVFNKDPLFADISEYNYAIDSLSPAKNIGDIDIATLYPLDLNQNSRLADTGPDLGALEWISSKEAEK